MDSKLGLLIQLTGVLLITILTIFLQRSLRSVALRYWAYAWLCLSFALICLRWAFDNEKHAESLYSLYFFGEYLFGFMLVAGCRNLNEGGKARLPDVAIIPLGIVAIALPVFSANFDEMYSVHCLFLAGFFAFAFAALRKAKIRTFGWRVMHISVGLLALEFFLFFTVFTLNHFIEMPMQVLQFSSVIDLVLQTALGFGMVIVLLEKLLMDVKTAHDELAHANGRLEELVNTDPLTEAFNRHAFYGFVKKGQNGEETVSGCVGFFDIDNLKEINDQHGHAAGDQAIRAVARAIRTIIRAEDLIYRWGGDEFFVVMVGLDAGSAADRMQRLDELLRMVYIEDVEEPIFIGVSAGFCDFRGTAELEKATKLADAQMYERKQQRKLALGNRASFLDPQPERPSLLGV